MKVLPPDGQKISPVCPNEMTSEQKALFYPAQHQLEQEMKGQYAQMPLESSHEARPPEFYPGPEMPDRPNIPDGQPLGVYIPPEMFEQMRHTEGAGPALQATSGERQSETEKTMLTESEYNAIKAKIDNHEIPEVEEMEAMAEYALAQARARLAANPVRIVCKRCDGENMVSDIDGIVVCEWCGEPLLLDGFEGQL